MLPMARDPDPTSSSWFPTARHPMGMGPWASFPMAWNPDPIPMPMNPMSGYPNSIWMGRCSINLHPGFRWSSSYHWGWTSQEKDSNGTYDNY